VGLIHISIKLYNCSLTCALRNLPWPATVLGSTQRAKGGRTRLVTSGRRQTGARSNRGEEPWTAVLPVTIKITDKLDGTTPRLYYDWAAIPACLKRYIIGRIYYTIRRVSENFSSTTSYSRIEINPENVENGSLLVVDGRVG